MKQRIILAGMTALLLTGCNVDRAYDEWKEEQSAALEEHDENRAPVISIGNLNTTAHTNTFFTYTPEAYDPDGDILTYSIVNKPNWALFDRATGTMSGTTEKTEAVYANIVIAASDGQITSELEPFDLRVVNENIPPLISGSPTERINISSQYYFKPDVIDSDGDTLIFRISNMPVWASFNELTGELTGATPGVGETNSNITISVSDGTDTTYLPAFNISVLDVNNAPVIEGVPTTHIDGNEMYEFIPTAADPDGDPLTFLISNMPIWLNFDSNTGRLWGETPNTNETFSNMTISVFDGEKTTTLPTFSITVSLRNNAPTIEGVPTTVIDGGQDYSFAPIVNDLDGDALVFDIASKPSWATFDKTTGVLAGRVPNKDASYPNITIYVTDGKDVTYFNSFSITVRADEE